MSIQITTEKKQIIRKMYPELDNNNLEKLLYLAEQTRLDPIKNQIYIVTRNVKRENGKYEKAHTIQTSIDGFRLIAERTGKYSPGKETLINFDDNGNIISATAYVKKMTDDKTWHEVAVTAYYDEYVQTSKDGNPTKFWRQMPKLMLSKCAEALALRKAFPNDLSGLYTDDEMQQAENSNKEVPKESEPETISEEEFKALVDKINEIEINDIKFDEDKFKKYIRCDDYTKMKPETYVTAMTSLDNKLKKANRV